MSYGGGAHMRCACAARIGMFLGALLAYAALVPAAGSAQLRGVGLHPQSSDHDATVISREMQMLQAAGADSVRFDVAWNSLEWTSKGQEDPGTLAWLDSVMASAHAHGLKVILDVVSTPCWASSAPPSILQNCAYGWWNRGVTNYAPTNTQDYADFCAFVAKRWAPSLAALELWNEPNGGQFFVASNPPQTYAALVRVAYARVKAVAPHLPVLMSLGGTDTRWLGSLYQYGVRGFYDGIAIHPYGDLELSRTKAFRAYMLSEGDSVPLWVTEVGWSSADVGPQAQATDDATMLTRLAALPYVAAVEVYDMRDAGTAPTVVEQHFGLVDLNLNAKPSWKYFVTALASLAASSPTAGVTPAVGLPTGYKVYPRPVLKRRPHKHRRDARRRRRHGARRHR